jgi:transcriptional/translational regulatory protein YebC/TACO1
MGVIDALEELDDVQQVYSTLDVSDELMAAYEVAS